MKASLKLREDQKPLFRAKVPISILGFPFQSGIAAGESKELSLSLSTFFESGPSLKMAYRPNDSINPFSLVFKTGIGHFGSPISSPMHMSTEFNLVGGQNPSFFVTFKPQLGNFSLKKSHSSVFGKESKRPNGAVSDEDDGSVLVESPESGKKFTVLPQEAPAAAAAGIVLSGVDAAATTEAPFLHGTVMTFRWGMRMPAPANGEKRGSVFPLLERLPYLALNKIGIERVARDCRAKESKKVTPGYGAGDDVAEACLGAKRQLEVLNAESVMLRKAMDDLKSELFELSRGGERGQRKLLVGGKIEKKGGGEGAEATEELKKAVKGVAGA